MGKQNTKKPKNTIESILTTNKEIYLMTQTREMSITRPIGLLANGVEIFPPTVFDEQIFHGNITEIKVTNPGEDYDVITGPPLVINDHKVVVHCLS